MLEQPEETQYFNIQEPETPEQATPPTPTPQEKKHIIKTYLETAELISDAEYTQLKKS